MKRLLPLFLFAAVAALAAYTKQNTRVIRAQLDTVYADASAVNATSVPMTGFVQTDIIYDSTNVADASGGTTWKKVSFDLLDANLTSTTITASGKTVTYPQLAALIRQAVLDRGNAQGFTP